MPTQNTSLKNTTPAGDSNTTNKMVIGKINTYQRTFLIVAGSLLALLVLVAVAGTNGDQHLQSSARKIAEGAVALADYQVDSASNSNGKESRELKQKRNKKAKNKKGDSMGSRVHDYVMNLKPNPVEGQDNYDLLSVSENYQGKCCTQYVPCWVGGCKKHCPYCDPPCRCGCYPVTKECPECECNTDNSSKCGGCFGDPGPCSACCTSYPGCVSF